MGQSKSKDAKGTDTAGAVVPDDPQSEAFVKGLMANGQAARAAPDGSLPSGVTHEIIGETAAGLPIVRRRRLSAF